VPTVSSTKIFFILPSSRRNRETRTAVLSWGYIYQKEVLVYMRYVLYIVKRGSKRPRNMLIIFFCTALSVSEWWVWNSRWNENWQDKLKYSEKTCPTATLSTTNPTRSYLVSNPGRRGGRPATNRLSYGTALDQRVNEFTLRPRDTWRFSLRPRGYVKFDRETELYMKRNAGLVDWRGSETLD
jgi:hypothetical protein